MKATFSLYNKHVALMTPLNSFIPKHHEVYHLLRNEAVHGNPTLYSNWLDESLNHTLKLAARNVSQLTFDRSLLLRMQQVLRSAKRSYNEVDT